MGIVLAVTLFACVHAQNSLFEIPNVYLQFFDRTAPPPFPFRPPPAQAPFAGRAFGRPGPFPWGPAPFLNPNGEFPSGLPAVGQRGPFGGGPFGGGPFGGRFGPGRGPFGGRRPFPPPGAPFQSGAAGQPGRGPSSPFGSLSQILPAASTDQAAAGKTEDKSTAN